jgi:two-component system chemotaxis response regulator CheY
MRALVVDDSALARFRLKTFLNKVGFSDIVEASEGYEALRCLESSHDFDLAMVDWIMPGMQGLELITAIRSDHTLDSMKILLVTTESDPVEVQRALTEGADDYVAKPCSNDDLNQKLTSMGLGNTLQN